MIVLNTDIVTLLCYGRTDKIRERVKSAEAGEEFAITIITHKSCAEGSTPSEGSHG